MPFVLRSHTHHVRVRRVIGLRKLRLAGHALAETYAVLTRLPGDARLAPADAAEVIAANFADPVRLPDEIFHDLPAILAGADLGGGTTYDALVGLAARSNGLVLATRDARAVSTYRTLGVDVELIGD